MGATVGFFAELWREAIYSTAILAAMDEEGATGCLVALRREDMLVTRLRRKKATYITAILVIMERGGYMLLSCATGEGCIQHHHARQFGEGAMPIGRQYSEGAPEVAMLCRFALHYREGAAIRQLCC